MLIRNIIRRGAAPWRQALHGPTPGGAARAPARELSTSAAPAATSWSRRALLGALCVGGAAGAALAGVAATNEGAYRSMLFWSQAFPPYAHYRVLEWWHEDVVGSPEHVQDAAFDALHERYAPEALRVILMLKGFYVKIGQIGSTRGDFLPEIYLDNLATLQDGVPPESISYVKAVVAEELGRPFEEVFEWIEDAPLGAATIGQVHLARLVGGREVVVKVQYPTVERLFDSDISTIRDFCALAQPEFLPILEEIRRQFMTEFDYTREGRHLEVVRANLKGFRGVVVPRPLLHLTTRKVLVMERVPGMKLVDGVMSSYEDIAAERGMTLAELKREYARGGGAPGAGGKGAPAPSAAAISAARGLIRTRDFVSNLGIRARNMLLWLTHPPAPLVSSPLPLNAPALVEALLAVHAHEIFEDGLFNGDPHPGNILLCPDGKLGLIDYGQVKKLTLEQRLRIAELVVALADGNREGVVDAYTRMGFRTAKMDHGVIHAHATIGFDTDDRSVTGGENIQKFFESLNKRDKTEHVPDFVVLPGRVAVLMRGLASLLQMPPLRVAEAWAPVCRRLLRRHKGDVEKIKSRPYPAMDDFDFNLIAQGCGED